MFIFASKLFMRKHFLIIAAFALIFSACRKPVPNRISGAALGTVYTISYTGKPSTGLHKQIDSVLQVIDSEFSVFDTTSLLSSINRGETLELNADFIRVLERSLQISQRTGGAFDCTLQPLIELWGFGRQANRQIVSAAQIDSVKQYVGYMLVDLKGNCLIKKDPRVQLNFNAIAKGYAVDKIAALLLARGYLNFVVEVGGEVVTKGTKNGKAWKIGIQVPTKTADGAEESCYTFPLRDKAVATSGNYRNYFEENGIRYTHILNPATGRPEHTSLLSVSVMAADCMTADAYATAFMVMGIEEAMPLANRLSGVEAYFIYDDHGQLKTAKTSKFP